MITRHGEDYLVLHDGVSEHRIAHAAFAPMQPHHKGGIHPAVTEDHQAWLHVPNGRDLATCPVEPVSLTFADLHGGTFTAHFIPITAWLQAPYGPDGHIVSVPINGDAHAQRLHWLHRNEDERKEMRALLEWMGAWRLNDDGTVPSE